jgi:hypothetical protein
MNYNCFHPKAALRICLHDRKLTALFCVVVVVFAGFFPLFVWSYLQNAWNFSRGTIQAEAAALANTEAEASRLRGLGEPVTVDELEDYYAITDGAVDTTKLWAAAAGAFYGDAYDKDRAGVPLVDTSMQAVIPPPGDQWPELLKAEQFLGRYQQQLDLIHSAARSGDVARFPTRFEDGLLMLMPEVHYLMKAPAVLGLEAHVRAHRRDPGGVVDSMVANLAVAKCLDTFPNEVAQFVCASNYYRACQTLETLLPYANFSEEDLSRLDEALVRLRPEHGLRAALLGQRVVGLHALEHPYQYLETLTSEVVEDARRISPQQARSFALFVPLVKERDKWFFLRHTRILCDATKLPWPERFAEVERAEQQWAVLARESYEQAPDFDSVHGAASADRVFLAHPLANPLSLLFDVHARAVSLHSLARVAVAIQRHRLRHGRDPEILQELVPTFLASIPEDPFGQGPLRYVRDSTECRLYSVGKNRTDEGGDDNDIAFTVPIMSRNTDGED